MTRSLHLIVTTPAKVLAEADNVVSVRAEDESGSFGILPGHSDLLTVLTPSVVHWRGADGATSFCAVRGGVFTVSAGRNVAVACREGVVSDSLQDLEAKVRAVRAQQLEDDHKARVQQVRTHAFAVRQLVRYLHPDAALVALRERESKS
jgi:F-type H+-transporting ATPase subunit epsilon